MVLRGSPTRYAVAAVTPDPAGTIDLGRSAEKLSK